MTNFCKHLRNKEAPLYPQGCMLGNATSPLWCEKKERCCDWETSEDKITFPITFKTPEELMKFVGGIMKDDLIREATKMHIAYIENKQKKE